MVYEPKGIEFNKKQTEYNLFPEEYFSGTDCYIYFNDVWHDDVIDLSFQLKETVVPIFSYASKTWDWIARGNRVVHGSFTVAFKEAGHLWTIMDHIGQLGPKSRIPRLAYWMDQEQDVEGRETQGLILENIEDLLNRYHSNKDRRLPDKEVTEKVTKKFKWTVPMKMWETDQLDKHKNQEERYGLTTSIRQAQTWLQKNGYSFPAKKFNWGKYYAGDTWYASPSSTSKVSINVPQQVFTSSWLNGRGIGRNSGDWYMLLRFNPNNDAGIGGSYATSTFEKQLQQRLNEYPGGLEDHVMTPSGGGTYDGRYGGRTAAGVRKLLQLAEHNDGSNGYWVSSKCKELLEAGFAVTGVYDFPTKLAVWSFQKKMIHQGKLKKSAPDGIIDKATMDLMTEEGTVTRVVPGKSLYRPEELYENRVAMYEREVWGRRFVEDSDMVRKQESFFYRTREVEEPTGYIYRPLERLEQTGIDIYINYGPLPQYIQSRLDEVTKNLDNVSFNTTVKAIRNVQLVDVEKVISAETGEPIKERYYFIAQDLD